MGRRKRRTKCKLADGNFFSAFPQAMGDVFNGNAVAGVFVVSLVLSFVLPKEKNRAEE